jgi:periplasmic protein TonB
MKSILTFLFCFTLAVTYSQTDSSLTNKNFRLNTDSVYDKPDVEAQFPGGENKWNKYVQSVVEKNIDDLVDDKKSRGTCILKFIVDTNGVVSALRVTTLEGTVLGKISSSAILNGPNWIPATVNGVNVKSVRIQKVTFRVTRG